MLLAIICFGLSSWNGVNVAHGPVAGSSISKRSVTEPSLNSVAIGAFLFCWTAQAVNHHSTATGKFNNVARHKIGCGTLESNQALEAYEASPDTARRPQLKFPRPYRYPAVRVNEVWHRVGASRIGPNEDQYPVRRRHAHISRGWVCRQSLN